jgi:hypothetical protein|tara:strand:- start:2282 stop:2569 length:288 start_codon:yes stop_codon:yes gene_type:complete
MTKLVCYLWAFYHFTLGVKYEKSKKYSYLMGVVMIVIGFTLSIIIKLNLDDDIYLDKLFIIPLGIYSVIKVANIFNKKNDLSDNTKIETYSSEEE